MNLLKGNVSEYHVGEYKKKCISGFIIKGNFFLSNISALFNEETSKLI